MQKDAGPTLGGLRRRPSAAPRAWPTQGRRAEGTRRPEAQRCRARAAGRCSRRSAAEENGDGLGRLRKEQRRCHASCRGEGREPTRGDSGRWVSARSRAVGSTGQGAWRAGTRSCPYMTWAGSAQLRERREWQEPTRHARPTSERPSAAREDGIAADIVQGNGESACRGSTTRAGGEEGGGRGRVSKRRGQRWAEWAWAQHASGKERKEGVAEQVQRSRRWEGSNTAKEEGAGKAEAEGQSRGRERARTEHRQGSEPGQARGGRGCWRGGAEGQAWWQDRRRAYVQRKQRTALEQEGGSRRRVQRRRARATEGAAHREGADRHPAAASAGERGEEQRRRAERAATRR